MLSVCKSDLLSLTDRNVLVAKYFDQDLSDNAIYNSYYPSVGLEFWSCINRIWVFGKIQIFP